MRNEERRETFFEGTGLVFGGKSVRTEVAGDAVVDLNKMFFSGNGLETLVIQTVVHLRSAAI
jgi:hypothetical protein